MATYKVDGVSFNDEFNATQVARHAAPVGFHKVRFEAGGWVGVNTYPREFWVYHGYEFRDGGQRTGFMVVGVTRKDQS
jgi:hypothetical protein